MQMHKKWISLVLILTFLSLFFTACSEKTAGENTSASSESQTQDIVSTGVVTEQSSVTQKPTSSRTVPQTTADCITAYNQALQKHAPKCTASAQKITKGKLWLGNDTNASIDLLAGDQTELLAKFEQNNVSGTSLTQLSASDVSAAKISGNTVVFTLGSISTSDSISQGKGGYLALIDDARTKELVSGVKEYANVSGDVKITSAAYRLSEGMLTVTFNEDFTEIQSVQYTGKQNVTAKMRYLVMTINADLDYQLSAEFK